MANCEKAHLEHIDGECPNCGSYLIFAVGRTRFYGLVDNTEGFGSNKRVQEKTGVPRRHITQMQYCCRYEEESRFEGSVEIVAQALGVSTSFMLSPDPYASHVVCLTCGERFPRFIWDSEFAD